MARNCGEVRPATRRTLEAAEVVIVGGLVIAGVLASLWTLARWVMG